MSTLFYAPWFNVKLNWIRWAVLSTERTMNTCHALCAPETESSIRHYQINFCTANDIIEWFSMFFFCFFFSLKMELKFTHRTGFIRAMSRVRVYLVCENVEQIKKSMNFGVTHTFIPYVRMTRDTRTHINGAHQWKICQWMFHYHFWHINSIMMLMMFDQRPIKMFQKPCSHKCWIPNMQQQNT